MINYPPVGRKLPELFEVIIDNDKAISRIKQGKIISMKEYTENVQRKYELINAAEGYISRAKKDGPGASV